MTKYKENLILELYNDIKEYGIKQTNEICHIINYRINTFSNIKCTKEDCIKVINKNLNLKIGN